MANETKQLTVADLEAAKEWYETNARQMKILVSQKERYDIAATCIGIVEEMVKLKGRNLAWGELKFSLNHIYEKAVAAFGGEVKR